jgi:hypothetical protein
MIDNESIKHIDKLSQFVTTHQIYLQKIASLLEDIQADVRIITSTIEGDSSDAKE